MPPLSILFRTATVYIYISFQSRKGRFLAGGQRPTSCMPRVQGLHSPCDSSSPWKLDEIGTSLNRQFFKLQGETDTLQLNPLSPSKSRFRAVSFSIAAKYHFEHGTCRRSYLIWQWKTGVCLCDRSEATWIQSQPNNRCGKKGIEARVIVYESCKNSRTPISQSREFIFRSAAIQSQFIPLAIS